MSYVTYDDFESARGPSAVYWLIGLCVAVYFVQATLVGDANMANWFGYAAGDMASGSMWTIATYMFVHGGLMHLLLNLWTLWLFGPRGAGVGREHVHLVLSVVWARWLGVPLHVPAEWRHSERGIGGHPRRGRGVRQPLA